MLAAGPEEDEGGAEDTGEGAGPGDVSTPRQEEGTVAGLGSGLVRMPALAKPGSKPNPKPT